MKKKVIVYFLFILIFCFFSCSGTKIPINTPACNGIRPKQPVYVMNYYKTDIYKRHIRLMDLQERTSRKSKNSYNGKFRY